MHARIAARRAWLDYERNQALPQEVQDMYDAPIKRKSRPRYAVQFGLVAPGRATDLIPCKDARDAAVLASNACFLFGAPSHNYREDFWILQNETRDTLEWNSQTHFVRLTRTYP